MSAESPKRNTRSVPIVVPPQVVSDRSIIDSVAGFLNEVSLTNQPQDPKDTITWARFESGADISDPRFGDDWESEGNVAPPLLLILGYGLGVQVWAIPANGEAVEVLAWRHGIVSALRVLPSPNGFENGRTDAPVDLYIEKRPLMAICDGTSATGNQPQFCAVNFISLKSGVQVKTIKFKNSVLDILSNKTTVVITFHERIAVFDARTLEDRLSITTCYPSPGINPNPVALGNRWMAYSEMKLIHTKRSGGGCDGEGVSSYTATVLNAAKSFGKGLRELGEQVAAGLTGTSSVTSCSSKVIGLESTGLDCKQPGVVTILDVKNPFIDISPTTGTPISINGNDPLVAHFIAHTDAIVAMEFDNSGLMLLTADKRGHDFHIFRIQPHPIGSSLAAVHHLYVLHRGDTSAKVQNITFSLDSRWVAVSTLRGTTHVFPVTPYGGPVGARTHTSMHVVNKLSRFHRSAGLTSDGRSGSPLSHSDSTTFSQLLMPYHNPTMPPFPRPTVILALAQLRQPCTLNSPAGSAQNISVHAKNNTINTRQRLPSLSDDNGKPLSVCAIFAKSRSWLLDPPNTAREAPYKIQRKSVDSIFIMAGHGALIQYDLDTKLASNVAKEKISDDTPIELEIEPKAQWNLGRKDVLPDITPPLCYENWLIRDRSSCVLSGSARQYDDIEERNDTWLSQVEIITHAGPHRRLWMGPQFVFKTYNTPSGCNLNHIDSEAVEIGISISGSGNSYRPGRSSPLNMPSNVAGRSGVPVLIESSSYSSIEQSPKLTDRFKHEQIGSDFSITQGDSRLKEDLADAMREFPANCLLNTKTGFQQPLHFMAPFSTISSPINPSSPNTVVCSLPSSSSSLSTPSTAATALTNLSPSSYNIRNESSELTENRKVSIEKVVNPLGTVTTITKTQSSAAVSDDLDEIVSKNHDYVIHENCDESLFRPIVAIFCDNKNGNNDRYRNKCFDEEANKPPETVESNLIVPVIDESVYLQLNKKQSNSQNVADKKQQRKFFGNQESSKHKRDLQTFSEVIEIEFTEKEKGLLENQEAETRESGLKGEKIVPMELKKIPSNSVTSRQTNILKKQTTKDKTVETNQPEHPDLTINKKNKSKSINKKLKTEKEIIKNIDTQCKHDERDNSKIIQSNMTTRLGITDLPVTCKSIKRKQKSLSPREDISIVLQVDMLPTNCENDEILNFEKEDQNCTETELLNSSQTFAEEWNIDLENSYLLQDSVDGNITCEISEEKLSDLCETEEYASAIEEKTEDEAIKSNVRCKSKKKQKSANSSLILQTEFEKSEANKSQSELFSSSFEKTKSKFRTSQESVEMTENENVREEYKALPAFSEAKETDMHSSAPCSVTSKKSKKGKLFRKQDAENCEKSNCKLTKSVNKKDEQTCSKIEYSKSDTNDVAENCKKLLNSGNVDNIPSDTLDLKSHQISKNSDIDSTDKQIQINLEETKFELSKEFSEVAANNSQQESDNINPWKNASNSVKLVDTPELLSDPNYPDLLEAKSEKLKRDLKMSLYLSQLHSDSKSISVNPNKTAENTVTNDFHDSSNILKPLETLVSPLPILKPLDVSDVEADNSLDKNEVQPSLINLESPLYDFQPHQPDEMGTKCIALFENKTNAADCTIAAGGSLHFEHENTFKRQINNKTNATSVNDKLEKSVTALHDDPKKTNNLFSKKQKQKEMQILDLPQLFIGRHNDDEELRPLISMIDSHLVTCIDSDEDPIVENILETDSLPQSETKQETDSDSQKISKETQFDKITSNAIDSLSDNSSGDGGAAVAESNTGSDADCDTLASANLKQKLTTKVKEQAYQQQQQNLQLHSQNPSKKKSKRRKR